MIGRNPALASQGCFAVCGGPDAAFGGGGWERAFLTRLDTYLDWSSEYNVDYCVVLLELENSLSNSFCVFPDGM